MIGEFNEEGTNDKRFKVSINERINKEKHSTKAEYGDVTSRGGEAKN